MKCVFWSITNSKTPIIFLYYAYGAGVVFENTCQWEEEMCGKNLTFSVAFPVSAAAPLSRIQQEVPSKAVLEQEMVWMKEHLSTLGSPVVLCHNDLLCKNIIHNSKEGRHTNLYSCLSRHTTSQQWNNDFVRQTQFQSVLDVGPDA